MTSVDTIFAVATPPGRSAIAVLRISGPQAAQAPALFGVACPEAGQFKLARLSAAGQVIDEALILFMQAPRSSTGEDVCEIHCHGSTAVLSLVLEILSDAPSFRLADAGEFTRRAFMHNKLDLLSVEGLADVIDAETPKQLHQAWAQIDGYLRGPVARWREDLIALASQLEALIDFADEDLPQTVEATLRHQTALLIGDIAAIMDDQRAGELVRDGVVVALVGPVNAGKSTILNRLAGREAAIVSDQAGTTRDIISVRLDIDGVPVTILDTAGIRDAAGVIEAEGIRRTLDAAQHADVVVLVVDAAAGNWRAEMAQLGDHINQPDLVILNKVDQGVQADAPAEAMQLSAQNDADITHLMQRLGRIIIPHNQAQTSALITRVRHRHALQQAHQSLSTGLQHDFHQAPELAAEDFRQAAMALGRITGDVDVEELLGQIFSSFCIGK
ncbi:tRNA uridine-5-carboxymethylaminomethyl(34) synthesis GTPase MnmE [Alphaproteobacteria bacterium]|nr:tRNA uridine-5-carboxymethylaminomethyl(34) synthesis GTPase MnmE [Alphaproteobacteria bacterium]